MKNKKSNEQPQNQKDTEVLSDANIVRRIPNRKQLIELCEKAIVKEKYWHDRDSASSQGKVGLLWAYLTAGCEYRVRTENDNDGDTDCITDKNTIWIDVWFKDFNYFEDREEKGWELVYLPTERRLKEANGRDWY